MTMLNSLRFYIPWLALPGVFGARSAAAGGARPWPRPCLRVGGHDGIQLLLPNSKCEKTCLSLRAMLVIVCACAGLPLRCVGRKPCSRRGGVQCPVYHFPLRRAGVPNLRPVLAEYFLLQLAITGAVLPLFLPLGAEAEAGPEYDLDRRSLLPLWSVGRCWRRWCCL